MKKIRDRNMAYDDYVINANRVWSARLYYKANGQWVAVSNDYVQSMTINDYVCDGSNLTMGCFAGSKATLQLKNVSASVSAALVENVRVKVELSLTTDAIGNVGAAVLQSPVWVIAENKRKKRQGNTYDCSLTVYDISYTMTRSYTQTADTMTASQVVTAVGQRYGLTVDSSVASIVAAMDGNTPHTFGVIDSDITDKQMLAYVAGYYGCYAEINESEQICFSWFKTSDEVIGPDRIYDGGVYVTEMTERTIVMLESGTSDNPIVAPDNASGFSINYENPYIDAERVTAIYNAKIADGKISFRIGKVHYKGNPINNPGTIVTVKDIDDDAATFYIMKRTLNYDGGLSETIECVGESEQTINYKVASPIERKINRKFSRMEEAIKNATDVITQTKGSIYELIPADENDPSKGNSGWKLHSTDESKQNVILANSSGIGFSSNGGQSFNAAAIYIDDQGVGHINANYINTGKLSADLIDTSRLVVSKGNVTGLDAELDAITNSVDTANTNASNAQTTASSAKTAAENAKTAAANASKTLTAWCYENNTTLIDGGKIYTGSIAANSIDVSKLKAGTGELVNLFYNADFSKSTTSVWGWQGYNTLLIREGSYVSAKYLKIGANLIDHDTSEFISTNKWSVQNATFTKPFPSVDYIQFTPTSSSSSYIFTPVKLENGKKYSVSAQINATGWAKIASGSNPCIGVIIGNSIYYKAYGDASNFTPATGENNIEFVFTYTGASSDSVDVGFAFNGMLTSDNATTNINIAWIACCEVEYTREYGFYTSNVNWLANGYKTSHLVNSGNLLNTADKYIAHISTTQQSQLQIVLQKRTLEKGKRYVMLARLKFLNLTEVNSGAALGWWHGSGYWYDNTTLISSTSTSNYFTAKFVFDYNDDTGIQDVGIQWKGILDDASQPCEVRLHWFQLYQDDTAPLGFYASDASWLQSEYKESHLITNSDTPSDYNKKSGLIVYNSNLYFYGNVVGNVGNIGCLQYAPTQLNVSGATYYFEDAANPSTSVQESISSSLKIRQPDSIIDFNLDSYEKVNVSTYTSAHMTLRSESSYDEWDETDYTPAGVRCTNHKGNCVTLTADGIGLKKNGGLTLSWKQLYHLAQNTPET